MLLSVIQLSVRCFRGLKVAKVTSRNSYNQVQKYSRFASRRPVAIVNEDELFDAEEAAYPIKAENRKRRNDKFVRNEKISKKSHKNLDEEEEVDYSEEKRSQTTPKTFTRRRKGQSQPNVEIKDKKIFSRLYENEKLLSNFIMEIKSRRKRQGHDKILLEGRRFIADAIAAGEIPEMVIFSNPAELKKLSLPEDKVKVYKVPYRTIQLWSSLTTPPGIMGVFKTPSIESYVPVYALPITVICDNVRDPGNMGAIFRAAAGVGCEKVILTKGCVDLWESKVLRSAAGAHFRLPIYGYKDWDTIRSLISNNAQIIVADNKSAVEELSENENETEDIEQISNMEEENVKEDGESHNNRNNYEKIDLSNEIPVVPYFSIDYTQGETVIIVGGETEGLSEESFRLVDNSRGVRVNVPLNNNVESLNSGMALGVIAFEIKRQFLVGANKAVNQSNLVVDENGGPTINEGGVHQPVLREINVSTPSSGNDNAPPAYVNEQKFQRLLEQLLRNQEDIKSEIIQMKSASNLTIQRASWKTELFTEPILKRLPFQTIADVDHLNTRLENKEFQKIAYDAFDSIGGKNARDCVYRILKKIISSQLVMNCVWCARNKNKEMLSKRKNICLMILKIVRKQYGEHVRELDLKPYYIQYLKNAKKRRKREIANAQLTGVRDYRLENNLETDDE